MVNLDLWRGNKLSPFSGFNSLQRAMNRLFDDFWEPLETRNNNTFLADFDFAPTYDVEETDNHYIYSLDVPGVAKNDIKIEVVNKNLLITGERKEEDTERNKSGRYFEGRYGRFQRMFALPESVDPNKVEAVYENGVLRIAVPKTEEMKARQIPISEGKSATFQKSTITMKGSDEKKAGKIKNTSEADVSSAAPH